MRLIQYKKINQISSSEFLIDYIFKIINDFIRNIEILLSIYEIFDFCFFLKIFFIR